MDYYKIYKNYQKKINAYQYALWLISWDSQTEVPEKGIKYQNEQRAVLVEEAYKLIMAEERIEAITNLYSKKELDLEKKREIELEYKNIERLKKLPKELYLAYQVLVAETSTVYKQAKQDSNFKLFMPYLEKIINYNKQMITYLETEELKGYDVLLNNYEEGMGVKEYDEFFNLIKEKLVPFIKKVDKRKTIFPDELMKGTFAKDKQIAVSKALLKVVGYDFKKGVLKESIHPFTSGRVSMDTRITTAYNETALDSAIFSTIHEAGHGIYEQQINENYAGTPLGSVRSLGMHESQSRLYENLIGRSLPFWQKHFYLVQKEFSPQLNKIDYKTFYKFVNRVEQGFIRTEADELHYSIHVLIRYELEKQIFSNDLKVEDLPKLWNKMYKDYLGVEVKNDREGILQDIHWSSGGFGYFPTYALGSAYASHFFAVLSKEIDVEKAILEDNIEIINNWLKEHIHQFGGLKTPKQMFLDITKTTFDPNYYIKYLIDKYSDIYSM